MFMIRNPLLLLTIYFFACLGHKRTQFLFSRYCMFGLLFWVTFFSAKSVENLLEKNLKICIKL